MALQKGKRLASKIRIGLTGVTNGGKTLSALYLAYGIVKTQNPSWNDEKVWEHIAVGDTERKRALFYINRTDLPFPTGEFFHQSISQPYHPDKAMDFIKEASEAVGPTGVIILDSISHYWNYKGGLLDMKEVIAKQAGKNSYTAWNEAGQIQNEWLDVLLSANCHVIVTLRSKMDYVMELNDKGQNVPKKVGLAPIQRDDVEYEFDITLMLDKDHKVMIIKDTTFLNQLGYTGPITPELGEQLIKWLSTGADPKEFLEEELKSLRKQIKDLIGTNKQLLAFVSQLNPDKSLKDLSKAELLRTIKEVKEVI